MNDINVDICSGEIGIVWIVCVCLWRGVWERVTQWTVVCRYMIASETNLNPQFNVPMLNGVPSDVILVSNVRRLQTMERLYKLNVS